MRVHSIVVVGLVVVLGVLSGCGEDLADGGSGEVLAAYSSRSAGPGWSEGWPSTLARVTNDVDAEWEVTGNWRDAQGNTNPPTVPDGALVLLLGTSAGSLGLGTPRLDDIGVVDGVLVVEATRFTEAEGCYYLAAIEFQLLIVSLDGVDAVPDMPVDVRWAEEAGEPC